MRQHLESAERQTGKRYEELHKRCPPPMAYVWHWFRELHGRRQYGMTAQPLTYSEVDAWARLRSTAPTPDEVATLMALDDVYMEVRASDVG